LPTLRPGKSRASPPPTRSRRASTCEEVDLFRRRCSDEDVGRRRRRRRRRSSASRIRSPGVADVAVLSARKSPVAVQIAGARPGRDDPAKPSSSERSPRCPRRRPRAA
jgi:hypothetical protein